MLIAFGKRKTLKKYGEYHSKTKKIQNNTSLYAIITRHKYSVLNND